MGEGSTFWFDAPLAASQPTLLSPAPAEERAAPAADAPLDDPVPGPRVLLADGARINQLVGVALLERLGYAVDVVANGAEAVEAVRRTRYDAVLMDCLMPVMDGYEATGRIRGVEDGAFRTPITALTASALTGDRERCLAAGMDGYLSEPLDHSALAGVLARYCFRAA